MYGLRHALLVPVTDLIHNRLRNIIVKAWFKTDQLSLTKKKKKQWWSHLPGGFLSAAMRGDNVHLQVQTVH